MLDFARPVKSPNFLLSHRVSSVVSHPRLSLLAWPLTCARCRFIAGLALSSRPETSRLVSHLISLRLSLQERLPSLTSPFFETCSPSRWTRVCPPRLWRPGLLAARPRAYAQIEFPQNLFAIPTHARHRSYSSFGSLSSCACPRRLYLPARRHLP